MEPKQKESYYLVQLIPVHGDVFTKRNTMMRYALNQNLKCSQVSCSKRPNL